MRRSGGSLRHPRSRSQGAAFSVLPLRSFRYSDYDYINNDQTAIIFPDVSTRVKVHASHVVPWWQGRYRYDTGTATRTAAIHRLSHMRVDGSGFSCVIFFVVFFSLFVLVISMAAAEAVAMSESATIKNASRFYFMFLPSRA